MNAERAWQLAHAASSKPAEQLARLNRWLGRRDTDRALVSNGDLREAFEAAWAEQEQSPSVAADQGEARWCAWLWGLTRKFDWSGCPISIRARLAIVRDQHGVARTDDFLEVAVMDGMAGGLSTKEACIEAIRQLRERDAQRLIAEDIAEEQRQREPLVKAEARRQLRRTVNPATVAAWLRAHQVRDAANAGDEQARAAYLEALDVLYADPATAEADDFWDLVTEMAGWDLPAGGAGVSP